MDPLLQVDDRTVSRAHLAAATMTTPPAPEVFGVSHVPEVPWTSPPSEEVSWTSVDAPVGPAFQAVPGAADRPRVDIGGRVLAYLVDTVVVLVLLGVPLLLLDAVFPDPDPYGLSTGSSAQDFLHSVLVLGWSGLCLVGYVWTTGVSGQTVGKRLLGQQVVDVRTGAVIGFGRAFRRFVIEWLSNIVCYAGMWSAFLDSGSGRYQAWHDKACSTWVVAVPRRGIDSSLWTRR